jgi:hypothetical protein
VAENLQRENISRCGMIETIAINKEIYEGTKRLMAAGDALFKLAQAKAESERLYRKALGIEIVKLKTDKVQATLIPDVARGITADFKYERDLAEARYTAGRDNLQSIQSQLSALQSILRYQTDI